MTLEEQANLIDERLRQRLAQHGVRLLPKLEHFRHSDLAHAVVVRYVVGAPESRYCLEFAVPCWVLNEHENLLDCFLGGEAQKLLPVLRGFGEGPQ